MPSLPELVTDNDDPAPVPCRNICELPDAEAEQILDEIAGFGMPGGRGAIGPAGRSAGFVEVPVWDDSPVRERLQEP